jgi:hypothetical protein
LVALGPTNPGLTQLCPRHSAANSVMDSWHTSWLTPAQKHVHIDRMCCGSNTATPGALTSCAAVPPMPVGGDGVPPVPCCEHHGKVHLWRLLSTRQGQVRHTALFTLCGAAAATLGIHRGTGAQPGGRRGHRTTQSLQLEPSTEGCMLPRPRCSIAAAGSIRCSWPTSNGHHHPGGGCCLAARYACLSATGILQEVVRAAAGLASRRGSRGAQASERLPSHHCSPALCRCNAGREQPRKLHPDLSQRAASALSAGPARQHRVCTPAVTWPCRALHHRTTASAPQMQLYSHLYCMCTAAGPCRALHHCTCNAHDLVGCCMCSSLCRPSRMPSTSCSAWHVQHQNANWNGYRRPCSTAYS